MFITAGPDTKLCAERMRRRVKDANAQESVCVCVVWCAALTVGAYTHSL